MSIWINGQPATQLDASDRGLSYGDGLFRTLRLLDGAPLAWRWHWARLQHDCAALRLPCPEAELLLAELAAVSAEWPDAVAKLTLTRGVGPRGYAPPAAPQPTRIVQAGPRVAPPAERYNQGVAVYACALRLGLQPALAGVKHLNRLENVLARAEWQGDEYAEGLLCDSEGWVIEGTMSNLWIRRGRELLTPQLDRCGVSGAARAWVFDTAPKLGYQVREWRLRPADVLAADEAMLCNSLIGFWPIARYQQRRWSVFTASEALNSAWLAPESAISG